MWSKREPRIAGLSLSRLGLCVLGSHSCQGLYVDHGFVWESEPFFFFFGPAESFLPIQSLWPLLPKLSCLETGGGKQGFNVILRKTFTHKKFCVNIAAEDFSQLLLSRSGLNRSLDFTALWFH